MDNLLTIALEAHHADRNHHRSYRITIGRDLFCDWTVSICYGRTEKHGQEKRFGSPSADAMRKVVCEHLHRRLSAPKRIGCAYRMTGFSAASDFDASSWLPSDFMTRFIAGR